MNRLVRRPVGPLARALAILAVLALASAPAHAQSAGAQAELMFRNGKRLLSQGKIAEACAAFDASQRLEPTVSTLLNQANCREKNGQFATAWGLFLDAERDTRASTDDAGKQLHKVAADHAAKLEAQLSTLTIVVPAERRTAGLEIRRGNDLIEPVMWNQALPIDGGIYKIIARAPGMSEWSTTATIANANDAKTIELPKPSELPKPKSAPPAAPTLTNPAKPRPTAPGAPRSAESPKPPPAEPAEPLRIAGDGKSPWYCTEAGRVSVGTCQPDKERCEDYRSAMLAQIRDLAPCRAAYSVVCFGIAGAPHCAPSAEICETLRGSVQARASACQAKQVAVPPPPPPPKPQVPRWWCTDSPSSDVGICKQARGDCEAFRSSLLERRHDLTECHELATAMCFELGPKSYCAPSQDSCDALRTASHAASTCHAKQVPAPSSKR
jgi:hypothetical protein